MKLISGLFFCALFFLLSGCSSLFGREGYFRDRGDDYLHSAEIPPMKVPKELDSSAISELFVIPPISNEFVDLEVEFETPRSSFDASREKAQVKIQKLDNRRWILINSSPAIIWPRIKGFLEENQLSLAFEDPITGKMETGWLVLKDEPETKDRYRFQVEQGLHISTTEIHVRQITTSTQTPGGGNINWPSASSNPEREKWIIDKLAAYLAQNDTAPVSLVAQSIGRVQKVSYVQPYQSEAYILMSLDRERVMASVGGALNKAPFAVEDTHHKNRVSYMQALILNTRKILT
jgi:outer membrane protein assembly factor BamC